MIGSPPPLRSVTVLPLLTILEPQSRFWGQTSQIPSSLSPKRDCGPKRVNIIVEHSPSFPRRRACNCRSAPTHATRRSQQLTPVQTPAAVQTPHRLVSQPGPSPCCRSCVCVFALHVLWFETMWLCELVRRGGYSWWIGGTLVWSEIEQNCERSDFFLFFC